LIQKRFARQLPAVVVRPVRTSKPMPPGNCRRVGVPPRMKRFEKFTAPLLLVYGTGDPTTEEALAMAPRAGRRASHARSASG
jgi:hypothetical protein